MAELFGKVPQNITIHIKNIYKEGELDKGSTCKEYLQVAHEGSRNVTRLLKFYNLDVIISVGYRVIQKRTDTYVSARLSTQSSRRPEHLRKCGKNYATLRSFSPQGGSCSHKR
nr:RhuM family protein [Fibrobacter sp. UWOV1]